MCTLSEALYVFEDNLREVRQTLLDQISDELDELQKPIATSDKIMNDLQQQIYKLNVSKITEYRVKVINRITDHINIKKSPQRYCGRVSDEDIARAKDHPIEELYIGKLRAGYGKCPFHDEKTGSFHVKNNRFTCYGCGAWGSSIDFVMLRDSCTFIQAVKKLI